MEQLAHGAGSTVYTPAPRLKDRRLTARIRIVSAALVVAFAAIGGALYAERAAASSAETTQTVVLGDGSKIAGFDLSSLIAGGTSQQRLVEEAYSRVEHTYYKPVADQLLVNGEQKALTVFLQQRGKIAHPVVPHALATGDRTHDLHVLLSTLQTVQSRYPNVAPTSMFTQIALFGMLQGLGDPYTTYLSPQEINGLDEQLQGGNFGGIGVYIVKDKQGNVVVDPIEGNPAIKAGVRPGDIITAVDGKSTAGVDMDTIEREIRGPLGTVVSLTIRRHASASAPVVVRVTRADIHVPSVLAKTENGIEYVRLADFGQTSADEVRTALLAGKKHHVRGYILDLRNNGGGLLDAAVDISSLFIPSGPIVSTIDRLGERDTKSATGDDLHVKPLVLLVNRYTASASEITAGAVQDYHAGTLVGEKTFGKGVVQSLYTMPNKGALKITTARYVTPKGRDIQHKGIVPDVVVPQRVDLPIIDTPHDKQLSVAKQIIDRESKKDV